MALPCFGYMYSRIRCGAYNGCLPADGIVREAGGEDNNFAYSILKA